LGDLRLVGTSQKKIGSRTETPDKTKASPPAKDFSKDVAPKEKVDSKKEWSEPEVPLFPWPPPKASAYSVLPDELFRQIPDSPLQMRTVDKRIRNALDANGYSERSYYAVQGGFAMVTRLEQFGDDAKSISPPDRWATEIAPLREFSIKAYIEALFTAKPGRYRIIVFIVTPVPFSQKATRVGREEAIGWLNAGLNRLPDSIAEQPYPADAVCTAMIYEFYQPARGNKAEIVIPGRYSAVEHMERSKLLASLRP
jgi:hypothetical protein